MTATKEVPDVFNIFIRVRVVRVVPVHPLPETNRLLGLNARVRIHTIPTGICKSRKAISLNVTF